MAQDRRLALRISSTALGQVVALQLVIGLDGPMPLAAHESVVATEAGST